MTKIYITFDKPSLSREDTEFLRKLLIAKIVDGIKIGLTAFFSHEMDGVSVADKLIQLVRQCKASWIADAKLHDIPLQVAGATTGLMRGKPAAYTAHAQGGKDMMGASLQARDEMYKIWGNSSWPKPPLFAVTVLSSLSDNTEILHLLNDVRESGAEGVVCASKAILEGVRRWHKDLLTLVTSVRAPWATWIKNEDQKRSISPSEIKALQPTVVAIGRIVWDAPNPYEIANRLSLEIR